MRPTGGGSRAAEDGDSPVHRSAEDEAGTFPAGRAAAVAAGNNPGRNH